MSKHREEKRESQVPFMLIYLVFIMLPIGMLFLASRMLKDPTGDGGRVRERTVASPKSPRSDRGTRRKKEVKEDLSFLERLRRKIKSSTAWSGSRKLVELDHTPATDTSMRKLYQKHYNAKGIYDEAYIDLMVLQETSTSYRDTMITARKYLAMDEYDSARSLLESALLELEPHHLFAREELISLLLKVERQAAHASRAEELHTLLKETHLEITKVIARAQREAGRISGEAADKMVQAAEASRDQADTLFSSSAIWLQEGQDPDQAHMRIGAMLGQMAGEAQGLTSPGGR